MLINLGARTVCSSTHSNDSELNASGDWRCRKRRTPGAVQGRTGRAHFEDVGHHDARPAPRRVEVHEQWCLRVGEHVLEGRKLLFCRCAPLLYAPVRRRHLMAQCYRPGAQHGRERRQVHVRRPRKQVGRGGCQPAMWGEHGHFASQIRKNTARPRARLRPALQHAVCDGVRASRGLLHC